MFTVEWSVSTVTSQGHRTRRKPCRKGLVVICAAIFASRIKQQLPAYADKSVTIGEIRENREL